MKKVLITISIAGLCLFLACTKQELTIIDDPMVLDENSRQYQAYMAERATNFIKLFRFDKLGDIRERIKDPEMKAKIDALYREYRTKAENEALYFVTPKNDTLYFLPSLDLDYPERFFVNFEPSSIGAGHSNMINSEGILQGFQNYPNLTDFMPRNCFATGLKGLEFMPEMTYFGWKILWLDDLKKKYPDREFAPTRLKADLSQNHKLETIAMNCVDISDMKFPSHQMERFELKSSEQGMWVVINNSLGRVNADDIYVVGELSADANSELTLSNTVRRLNLSVSGTKKLDLKNVKGLEWIRLYFKDIEELTLPDEITDEILDNSGKYLYYDWEEPLQLKQGCTIHNVPDGVDISKYVRYLQ